MPQPGNSGTGVKSLVVQTSLSRMSAEEKDEGWRGARRKGVRLANCYLTMGYGISRR